MYQFHIGDIILPVAPKAMTTKINNNNKTFMLINEGEINVLKDAKLTDVSFDALLPNVPYPFAKYPNGFQRAGYYLEKLEQYKSSKEPFQFVVSRTLPNGTRLFDTSMKCSLENYSIKEDSKSEAFDVVVSIQLKQYKDYQVKTFSSNQDNTISVTKVRETSNSPAPKKYEQIYKVQSGDTLWTIAKKIYGDGSKYTEIAKRNNITNPNLIYAGSTLQLPVL